MPEVATRWPDFFVVGAPKCGTTTLFSYLEQHPDVYMPPEKELYDLCPDIFPGKTSRAEREYLALFADGANRARIGEGTPFYLYSTVATERIATMPSHPRAIVAVRNPIDMMFSLHGEHVYQGTEPIADFAAAVAADESAEVRAARPLTDVPRGFDTYAAQATLSTHLQRYRERLGRDRVLVVVFDDLRADASATLSRLSAFLGIRGVETPKKIYTNPRKGFRSPRLTALLRRPPEWSMRFARAFLPRGFRRGLVARMWDFNTTRRAPPGMRPETRASLAERFADEVRRLESLLERDLSHWLAVDRAP